MIILFCTKCGNRLAEGARFCDKCGNSVVLGEQIQQEEVGQTVQAVQPELQKPKKAKKSMGKLGTIAVALILVIGVGFFFKDLVVYGILPEKYVLSSLNKTFKSVNKDIKDSKTKFVGEMSQASGTNNLKMMVKNIRTTDEWANEDLNMFNGMGIELSTAMHKNGKALYLSGKTIYNESDLISLNAKLDDNELLVSIPELYNKSFTLPSRNFGQQWNMSNLASESNIYLDDSLDISFSELIEDIPLQEVDSRTKTAYSNAFKNIMSNARVEKAGSEKLIIGDKGRKCNKTTVTLNSHAINSGLIELIGAFENDNRLEQFKENLRKANQDYFIRYGIEESLENLKYMVNEDFDLGRIAFDIYTHNGQAVKIDLNLVPDMDYREDSVRLSFSLLGEKDLMDDFKFEFTAGGNEEAKAIITSKNNNSGNKKIYSNDTNIILSSYGSEDLRLNFLSNIDLSKSRDNLRFDLNLRSDDANVSLKVNGDFKTSSKEIEYNLHDLVATMEDYYGDQFVFEGSILLGWEDSVKKISSINDTQKLEVLNLNEYDVYEIAETVEMNMTEIMYSLGLY